MRNRKILVGDILPVAVATDGLFFAPQLFGIRSTQIVAGPTGSISKGLMYEIQALDRSRP